MDCSYVSLRNLEKKCKTDIRYMWLMHNEQPTYKTFGNFINDYLKDNIENIFYDITIYNSNAGLQEERLGDFLFRSIPADSQRSRRKTSPA